MILKHLFDKIASLLGLIIATPIFMVVASLIKIKMPDGPIIFRQKRVGRNGELFTIYKFRTMSVHHNQSSISIAGEKRITQLGKILRHYKIDELPELWNILIGDMSFVGPRPDVPGYADCLQGDDRRILQLRPGITGPASLKYRNEEYLLAQQVNPQAYNDNVIFPDKVRLNLYYLDHYNFWDDIRMIVATVLGKRIHYAHEII